MTDWPDHFCPACGVRRSPFPRYPWHMCNDCCASAVDAQGRALTFFNTHPSGGFGFAIAGTEERYGCRGVIALIAQRPAFVTEARFGGIVAQPVPDLPLFRDMTGVADLTSKVNPPHNLRPLTP